MKPREELTDLRDARKRIRLLEQENEVLRGAAAYLSQANLPGSGPTRSVSELADDGIPVAVPFGSRSLPASSTTGGGSSQVTQAELVEAYRANALLDAHRDDPEFG